MVVVALVAAVLAFAAPVFAQSSSPAADLIADEVTGCRVSNPNPQPNDKVRWSGACFNGIAQGRGVIQWLNDGKPNERYDGTLRDGKMEGFGVYTFSSGNRYEGEWRQDKRHGNGRFTFANGSHYDGEWRDDKPDGLGTYTTRDGDAYTGTWTRGCYQEGPRRIAVGSTKKACGFE